MAMVVIHAPIRLKIAVSMLLLSVPLVMLQVILVNQSPWWNLPWEKMGYFALAFFLIIASSSLWILSGKKSAFYILSALSALWILISAFLAYLIDLPVLSFFTLLVLAFIVAELSWLYAELRRSFLLSPLKWYQGTPREIAGLKCYLKTGDDSIQVRVNRLDQDGAFIFLPVTEKRSHLNSSFMKKKSVPMKFSFQGKDVVCSAFPTTFTPNERCGGFHFKNLSPDARKDLLDLIENLQAAGVGQ